MRYCINPFVTVRRPTHEVLVGNVGIGGNNPIRIQSMTNTDTMNTEATVKQIVDLYEAGCEIARVTAPSVRAAENLKLIKNALLEKNITIPLVADIHFTPNAALEAAEHVAKVRINPGNYAEKGGGGAADYSDSDYQVELERVEEKFRPLVLKCKKRDVSMRIGTNHGSLSERIMSRFGDTPEGMVESAMEFVYFAEAQDYDQIVLSMKASNPQVMIYAYRMLVERLLRENRTYPLHLGVTEAGGGLEGRVKSSSGIYSLLFDGLGDTVRVSLTETPVNEIPVAQEMVNPFNEGSKPGVVDEFLIDNQRYTEQLEEGRNPLAWTKASEDNPFPGLTNERALVFHDARKSGGQLEKTVSTVGLAEKDRQPDLILLGSDLDVDLQFMERHGDRYNFAAGGRAFSDHPEWFAALEIDVISDFGEEIVHLKPDHWLIMSYQPQVIADITFEQFADQVEIDLEKIKKMHKSHPKSILLLGPDLHIGLTRIISSRISSEIKGLKIVLSYQNTRADHVVDASGKLGALLLDGIGDGIMLSTSLSADREMELAFNILQAARLRITKTEFISCPSCGRTLFDLEETTEQIQLRTGHLKGLKIAVMGCIVNGPGEMADADFGYVGAGKNKINLYVGHEVVKKNIASAEAVEQLIQLIKDHNRWVEPDS